MFGWHITVLYGISSRPLGFKFTLSLFNNIYIRLIDYDVHFIVLVHMITIWFIYLNKSYDSIVNFCLLV